MKNKIISVFFLSAVIVSAILLSACPKPEEYPKEPNITFKEVIVANVIDILGNPEKNCKLVFSLIDGDGNIGIKDSDTTGIYNPADSSSIYRFDLYLDFYEIQNGEKILVNDSIGYRTPYIEPQGQNKTVKADIIVDYTIGYINEGVLKYDSIMFEFFMFDRLQNMSNTETSPVIYVDTTGVFNE